jgi:hypothetical protein
VLNLMSAMYEILLKFENFGGWFVLVSLDFTSICLVWLCLFLCYIFPWKVS